MPAGSESTAGFVVTGRVLGERFPAPIAEIRDARQAASAHPGADWKSLYDNITNQIIAELEDVQLPRGAVIEHGFSSQDRLTFHQAIGLGDNDRKGEGDTTVAEARPLRP